ncbi:MAG: class I SAM-dependent methyltransferase [Candidatus Aenigmarchaeota archaeon]|nr:class I SAM-dependent methyltransferase [Candidatus Aenigmarchaeota archaeon]
MISLDIGCGSKKKDGCIGIDFIVNEDLDVRADLEHGLPFRTASVDRIYATHFLEHVHGIERLLGEIHRVLKDGGELHAIVPYFRLSGSYHWNHKTYWSWYATDTKTTNDILGTKYEMVWRKLIVGNSIMSSFVNRFPRLYERFFVPFIPVEELRFVWKKNSLIPSRKI